MQQPITVDGSTLIASYEHVSRVIEVAGIPIAGWNDMTGGGIQRDGQAYVHGAGDEPRGLTDGKVTPQDLTLKVEIYTWEAVVKPALRAQALLRGDISTTAHQKVPFQIVDQFRGAALGIPSKTTTYTVKIGADKPSTPNDGNQFYQELTLKQTGVPKEVYL